LATGGGPASKRKMNVICDENSTVYFLVFSTVKKKVQYILHVHTLCTVYIYIYIYIYICACEVAHIRGSDLLLALWVHM
jgi:hypothetical protein